MLLIYSQLEFDLFALNHALFNAKSTSKKRAGEHRESIEPA